MLRLDSLQDSQVHLENWMALWEKNAANLSQLRPLGPFFFTSPFSMLARPSRAPGPIIPRPRWVCLSLLLSVKFLLLFLPLLLQVRFRGLTCRNRIRSHSCKSTLLGLWEYDYWCHRCLWSRCLWSRCLWSWLWFYKDHLFLCLLLVHLGDDWRWLLSRNPRPDPHAIHDPKRPDGSRWKHKVESLGHKLERSDESLKPLKCWFCVEWNSKPND